MAKELIKYRLKNFIKIVISIIIYAVVNWLIHDKVIQTFGYLAGKNAAIRDSVNAYLGNIHNILLFALFLNFAAWWLIACIPCRQRYWFESNTLIWAVLLSIFLFVVIFINNCMGGATIEALADGQNLYYSYTIFCAFLINVFGLPPQAVTEVIMPCKGKTRYIVVIIAVLTVGILMK